jgi:hypothetical protein
MANSDMINTAFDQLQSKAQTELLDAIDQLRQDGLETEFNAPELIKWEVIGA